MKRELRYSLFIKRFVTNAKVFCFQGVEKGCIGNKWVKVACRIQTWKKTFCQNSDYFGYRFLRMTLSMYLLCIYQNP